MYKLKKDRKLFKFEAGKFLLLDRLIDFHFNSPHP